MLKASKTMTRKSKQRKVDLRRLALTNDHAPSQQEVNDLLAAYNGGNLAIVEILASELVQRFPDHPFGWKILGVIFGQSGNPEKALGPMKQTVRLSPHDSEAHSNLGNALFELSRLSEAEVSCREAIRLDADNAQAHCNLGNVLKGLGRFSEAEASYRAAIRLDPDYFKAYFNLGNLLFELGHPSEAELSYREATRLNPNHAQAHSNLAATIQDTGRLTEAEASCREAIRLNPCLAEAHSNLGNVLYGLGRLIEAEVSCREAIRLNAGLAEGHSNLGNVLYGLGRLIEAEVSCREAIQLNPSLSQVYVNLGSVLKELGRLSEAEACYREAIRINPEIAESHSNLGNVLCDLGRLSEAEGSYREAIRIKPDYVEAHSNLLFSLNYLECAIPEGAFIEAQRFGAMVSSRSQPKFTSWHLNTSGTTLRIGFVSGDMRNHAVGFFIEGLIASLDRNQFRTYAFPTIPRSDDLTDRIKPFFDYWTPIYGKTDLEAASIIHDHGVNILIDLSGHTAHNRLAVFSYQPAPVQVSWCGYFATTGLPEMNYFLGDPIMSPENETHYFTEKIWRLPETWLCMKPGSQDISISSLPALKNGYVTFGCFGNLAKMNLTVVRAWSKILSQVPHSKLFLKSKQLTDSAVVKGVYAQFSKEGVAADRLILEGADSRSAYFEAYNRIDMVLDTFPYPGGTTSFDAHLMGVPVLTQKGSRFLSRLGESIAKNAGQTDWVAQDADEYVSKAITFSSDLDELDIVRRTLRDRILGTPLFKTKDFTKNFEDALKGMWNEGSTNIRGLVPS